MTHPVVARRRAEGESRIRLARQWAVVLARRLQVDAVVVVGSVAREDFNKWSDLDVLVVAEDFPEEWGGRMDLLMADAPPGLQPVGWTPGELGARRARRDPIALEAYGDGVVVWGAVPAG